MKTIILLVILAVVVYVTWASLREDKDLKRQKDVADAMKDLPEETLKKDIDKLEG